MTPKKLSPLKIFKEGIWYYVGRQDEWMRTRTGTGQRGFRNAMRLKARRSREDFLRGKM